MKRLYLMGAAATFVFTTYLNISSLKEADREMVVQEDTKEQFASGQLMALVVSLTWFISVPYIFWLNERMRKSMRQQS